MPGYLMKTMAGMSLRKLMSDKKPRDENAGEKLDHITPRERSDAAEKN